MAFLFKDYASGPWQPANQDGAVDLWDWDDASDVEWDDWRCDFDGGVDTIGLAGEGLQFQTTPTRKLEEPKKGRLRAQSAAQSPLDKLTSVEKIPSPNRLGPPTEEAESPRRARSSTIAAVRDGIPSFSITTSTSPAASPPRRTTSANVSSPSKAKRRPKDLKLFSDNLPKDATVEGGLKLQPRSPAPSYMTLPLLPPSPEL